MIEHFVKDRGDGFNACIMKNPPYARHAISGNERLP